MTSFIPTSQQAFDAWFAAFILLGIAGMLWCAWFLCDYGIDWIIGQWNRRHRSPVVDFEERRRLRAVVAIRGDR